LAGFGVSAKPPIAVSIVAPPPSLPVAAIAPTAATTAAAAATIERRLQLEAQPGLTRSAETLAPHSRQYS
jgi:hypothetical protein